jgi:DNA-binding MarR family transcriptional regulator
VPLPSDYASLFELRLGLRRFLHWSEASARRHGITPSQHQLLLAIRGLADGGEASPTISGVADALLLKHHSVVELVDRAQRAGLVARKRDAVNHSAVHLRLTDRGEQRLTEISAEHLTELARVAPEMVKLWAVAAELAATRR